MIATPGRYAKNGKRHKKQNASKKAAMVCAWVPGRGCGGVGGVGLRVNVTDSEPIGIYWAIAKPPSKEDFVFALPPAWPIFKLAKERGYLAPGPSPAGTCAVIKTNGVQWAGIE
jgi:type IV secretory pathway protease TraF